MLKSYGVVGWGGVVAHLILVSAQVILVLTLGLWTLDLGLTIKMTFFPNPFTLQLTSQMLCYLLVPYIPHAFLVVSERIPSPLESPVW